MDAHTQISPTANVSTNAQNSGATHTAHGIGAPRGSPS